MRGSGPLIAIAPVPADAAPRGLGWEQFAQYLGVSAQEIAPGSLAADHVQQTTPVPSGLPAGRPHGE